MSCAAGIEKKSNIATTVKLLQPSRMRRICSSVTDVIKWIVQLVTSGMLVIGISFSMTFRKSVPLREIFNKVLKIKNKK